MRGVRSAGELGGWGKMEVGLGCVRETASAGDLVNGWLNGTN